jgi:hypothetical protein
MSMQRVPPIIEGSYRVVGETARPRREPIFNHWRNAVPLLVLLGVQGLFAVGSYFGKQPEPSHLTKTIGTIILCLFAIGCFTMHLRGRGPKTQAR